MPNANASTEWHDETVAAYEMAPTFESKRLFQSWNECIRQILELRSLPDNWDGAGAERITYGVAYTAVRLVNELIASGNSVAPNRIVAMPTGGIVMEWHSGGNYTEAEIEEPLRVEWMFKAPSEPTTFGETHFPPEPRILEPSVNDAGTDVYVKELDVEEFVSTSSSVSY